MPKPVPKMAIAVMGSQAPVLVRPAAAISAMPATDRSSPGASRLA
jgi:hypothetical protein